MLTQDWAGLTWVQELPAQEPVWLALARRALMRQAWGWPHCPYHPTA